MIAYLSGAMEFANDEGAGWRKEVTYWLGKTLGHSVINPVLESEKLVNIIILVNSHGNDYFQRSGRFLATKYGSTENRKSIGKTLRKGRQ